MRLITHASSDEQQRVGSLDGYAPEEWTDRGEIPENIPVMLAVWDGSAIVPDLMQARASLWEQVKRIREEKVTQGVTVPGIGTFDSTQEARDNVDGAAGAALAAIVMGAPEDFSAEWTLIDNSSVVLSAVEMVQVQAAGVAFINIVHSYARSLRALIYAATSLEELEAIDIESGWPG